LGAGIVALVGVGIAAPAGAQPPSGYGFDGSSHNIVGGGSDTTYLAQLNISSLWLKGALSPSGCSANTGGSGPYPLLNSCTASGAPDTNTLGNYQHDSVEQATPTGSGAGIASLNDDPAGITYAGTANPQGTAAANGTPNCAGANNCDTGPVNVDFARSSRAPNLSGGTCLTAGAGGDELACDTFWGFASDGVTVLGFNGRGNQLNADATGLTAAEIFHIWNCDFHFWSDVPSLGIAAGSAGDGPIVPWGMNSSSGTFATFNSWVIANGGAPAGWTVNAQVCDHKLSPAAGGIFSFENDVKPIMNDIQAHGIAANADQTTACGPGLTADANPTYTGPASPLTEEAADYCHPQNQIWFSSFGVLSSFPFTANAQPTGYATVETAKFAAQILTNGAVSPPSGSNILAATWPIFRILYHVTRKVDADCPVAAGSPAFGTAGTPRPCNFANNVGAGGQPGPAIGTGANVCAGGVTGQFCDLNVVSGDSVAGPNGSGNSSGSGAGTLGGLGTRDVADGSTTAGSATVCSPSGGFLAGDVGQSIIGGGLNPNTYIRAFIAAGGACGAAPANGVTVSAAANAAAQGTQSPINLVVSGGTSGAVREYTRFLCRLNGTQQTVNPISGNNFDTDITSAIKAAGFQIVPAAKRTSGSRCAVTS
jgi:hypothetical protein